MAIGYVQDSQSWFLRILCGSCLEIGAMCVRLVVPLHPVWYFRPNTIYLFIYFYIWANRVGKMNAIYWICTMFQIRHSAKHIMAFIPFTPDRNFMVESSPLYRWGSWVSKRLSYVPRTQSQVRTFIQQSNSSSPTQNHFTVLPLLFPGQSARFRMLFLD